MIEAPDSVLMLTIHGQVIEFLGQSPSYYELNCSSAPVVFQRNNKKPLNKRRLYDRGE